MTYVTAQNGKKIGKKKRSAESIPANLLSQSEIINLVQENVALLA